MDMKAWETMLRDEPDSNVVAGAVRLSHTALRAMAPETLNKAAAKYAGVLISDFQKLYREFHPEAQFADSVVVPVYKKGDSHGTE